MCLFHATLQLSASTHLLVLDTDVVDQYINTAYWLHLWHLSVEELQVSRHNATISSVWECGREAQGPVIMYWVRLFCMYMQYGSFAEESWAWPRQPRADPYVTVERFSRG
jgi:hypothetical protein